MSAGSQWSSENIDKQIDDLVERDEDQSVSEQDAAGNKSENVSVVVRCRPFLGQTERVGQRQHNSAPIKVDELNKCIQIDGERQFYFDQVFGPESDNERVYMKSARKLVESAFKGYNCTIFMYGQTGTGKTYTHSSLTSSSFAHLFSLICDSNTQASFLIRASYCELYNESIRDLLSDSNRPLELRESKARGVYVKDLTCFLVNNLAELEKLKRLGDKRRATAATRMNEHSSRSHSIFSITIETVSSVDPIEPNRTPGQRTSKQRAPPSAAADKQHSAATGSSVRLGRLYLIDLAGSERQSKSGSTGSRLKEASRINLSLTCLSLVIRALTDKNSSHVPYRSSKLTRLLSSSLGGNSKTLLIACISPARIHLEETLDTLRFASRTKRIKNEAKINEDPKDALLRNYKRQISELRRKLDERHQQQAKMDETGAIGESGQAERPGNNDEQLMHQLRLLRAKIMIGGENLLEKAEMHERLLEASRAELEERRREEVQLEERLERKRTNISLMVRSKDSLESQRADLDEKLKRVLLLYRRSKDELRDLASEHEQLKASLLQTIRVTSKEIKYADCIIDDFIPREHLDLINAYAQYDDDSDEWQIKYIALSGNNIAQTRRLTEGRTGAPNSEDSGDSKSAHNNKRQFADSRPDPYVRF